MTDVDLKDQLSWKPMKQVSADKSGATQYVKLAQEGPETVSLRPTWDMHIFSLIPFCVGVIFMSSPYWTGEDQSGIALTTWLPFVGGVLVLAGVYFLFSSRCYDFTHRPEFMERTRRLGPLTLWRKAIDLRSLKAVQLISCAVYEDIPRYEINFVFKDEEVSRIRLAGSLESLDKAFEISSHIAERLGVPLLHNVHGLDTESAQKEGGDNKTSLEGIRVTQVLSSPFGAAQVQTHRLEKRIDALVFRPIGWVLLAAGVMLLFWVIFLLFMLRIQRESGWREYDIWFLIACLSLGAVFFALKLRTLSRIFITRDKDSFYIQRRLIKTHPLAFQLERLRRIAVEPVYGTRKGSQLALKMIDPPETLVLMTYGKEKSAKRDAEILSEFLGDKEEG